MSRSSLRSLNQIVRRSCKFRTHGSLSTSISAASACPSSSLQTLKKNPLSNPLYHLLPPTQNPCNLVELICSALKQPNCHLSLLQTDLKSILPHLNANGISRVLLRCQSDYTSALVFFNWVKNDLGHRPSTYNYCLIVHILSWSRKFGQAMNLLSELMESAADASPMEDVFRALVLSSEECNWDPVVFDMLIKAYLKMGLVREGFRTLVKTAELGFSPSVIACNFLIDNLLKMNCVEQCWHVYQVMGRMEIHPNSHTFNILTNVLCREGDVDKVNEFLEKMEEEGFDPDIVTYNTLISSYCRKGRMENAFYLFRIMYIRRTDPDLVTYTALICGLCRSGQVKEAHKLFHQMVHRGINPDIVAYNTLIFSYCKEAKMRQSRLLLHEMMGNGIVPDHFTFHVLIEGYVKSGKLISALNLAVELQKYRVSVSRDIYDYLMVSLCKGNRPFAAKNFLETISRDGYAPGLGIYNNLIESFCKNDDCAAEALLLKAEMFRKNIKPDLVTFRALVGSLCRTGRSKQSEELMEEMNEYGLSPDPEMLRALVKGYCREKNVERAESLLSFFALKFGICDSECYNALISIVSEEGDVVKLMELQDRALKIGFVPDRLSCKYTVHAMCKATEAH